MGKPVYEMDRLMRVTGIGGTQGKLYAQIMSYTVGTKWGKGVKKQVAGKRLIDFENLPQSATEIYLAFPKYGKGKRAFVSQRKWKREQVIKYFEPI